MRCFGNLNINGAKTTAEKICNVYDKDLISDHAVRNWFAKFRSGNMTLKNKLRKGRSSDLEDDL